MEEGMEGSCFRNHFNPTSPVFHCGIYQTTVGVDCAFAMLITEAEVAPEVEYTYANQWLGSAPLPPAQTRLDNITASPAFRSAEKWVLYPVKVPEVRAEPVLVAVARI
jgi:hypothetical protein